MVTLPIVLSFAAAMFGIGLYGALGQTNAIMVIMGVELVASLSRLDCWSFTLTSSESTRPLSSSLSIAVKSSRTVTRRASATRESVSRLASLPASSRWMVLIPTPLSAASLSCVQPRS